MLALGWHVLLFGVLVAVRASGAPVSGFVAEMTALGVNLFVLISLMVIFAYNELHCIIALADLLKQEERVALRRIFRQLDERWIHADVPNVIAMVSAHPRLYQIVGLVCSLLAVAHAGYVLAAGVLGAAALAVLRDALLIVLIQWQVQWYAAAYRAITGKLLPEK